MLELKKDLWGLFWVTGSYFNFPSKTTFPVNLAIVHINKFTFKELPYTHSNTVWDQLRHPDTSVLTQFGTEAENVGYCLQSLNK